MNTPNLDLSSLTPAQLVQLQKAAEALITEDQKYHLEQLQQVEQSRNHNIALIKHKDWCSELRNNMIEGLKAPAGFKIMEFYNPPITCKFESFAYYSRSLRDEYHKLQADTPYDKRENLDRTPFGVAFQEVLTSDVSINQKVLVIANSVRKIEDEKYEAYGVSAVDTLNAFDRTGRRPVFEFSIRKFTWKVDEEGNNLMWAADLKDYDKGKKTFIKGDTACKKVSEKWETALLDGYYARYRAALDQLISQYITRFNDQWNGCFKIVHEDATESWRTRHSYKVYRLKSTLGLRVADIRFTPDARSDESTRKMPSTVTASIERIQGEAPSTPFELNEINLDRLNELVMDMDEAYKAYQQSIAVIKDIVINVD